MKTLNPELSIVLREQTLEQHLNGSITGIIFWNTNDQNFPDEAWNDFVVIVICWWVKSVARLLDGTVSEENLDFMDGPYSINCRISNGLVACQFVERYGDDRVVTSWTGEILTLGEAILDVAKTTLRSCYLKSLSNQDIDVLNQEVNKLRNLINKRTKEA